MPLGRISRISNTPIALARNCHRTGRNDSVPTRYTAPMSAPIGVVTPPMITIVRMYRLANAPNDSGSRPCCWCARRHPATPARPPESANATTHPDRVQAVRLGRSLVVAECHERPPRAALVDALHQEEADDEHAEDHVVHAGGRLDVDPAEERRSGDATLGHPAEVLRIEQVRRRREREREGRHREGRTRAFVARAARPQPRRLRRSRS